MNEKRKIVLVGCGFVGMSMAYSFLNTGGIDELVLIDVDQEKAIGEAMDLQHGLPYARGKMSIKAGGYGMSGCGSRCDNSRCYAEADGNTSGSYSERHGDYEKRNRADYGERL